jgi:hypothetical protein
MILITGNVPKNEVIFLNVCSWSAVIGRTNKLVIKCTGKNVIIKSPAQATSSFFVREDIMFYFSAKVRIFFKLQIQIKKKLPFGGAASQINHENKQADTKRFSLHILPWL